MIKRTLLLGATLTIALSDPTIRRFAQAAPDVPNATFIVTNANDSGPGSLRQAIADANAAPGADTINITVSGTLYVSSTLHITDTVTIIGPGADQFTVDGGGTMRVVQIDAGDVPAYEPMTATLSGLTVQNGNARTGYGGGIDSIGPLTLTDVSLLNNVAAVSGGGVRVSRALRLIGGRFENNTATQGGGGLYGNSVNLSGTQFISNTSGYPGGGGAYVYSLRATGGRFENNHCLGQCQGGGMLIALNAPSLTGSQFINNTAADDGGGLYAYGTIRLYSARFENNRCTKVSCGGGGLYANDGLLAVETTFVGNAAQSKGGAWVQGDADIFDGRFEGNHCDSTLSCSGGGLYANARLTLSEVLFESNAAGVSGPSSWGAGGGAYANGYAGISGGRFVSNTAGGTITGGGGGGGLAADGGLYMRQTQFWGNVTGGAGGGVAATTAYVAGSQFIDNHAIRGGGAFISSKISVPRDQVSVYNSLFARNSAETGVALYLGLSPGITSTFLIAHATIDGVKPVTGTAITFGGYELQVYNTIISNHAVGISHTAGTVLEDGNLFFNNALDWSGMVSHSVQLAPGDPMFVNPALGDYHLSASSAAIDKVNKGHGETNDFENDLRPFNLMYDVGFDEYVPKTISGLSIGVHPLPTSMLGNPTNFAADVLTGTWPITFTWDFGDGTPTLAGTSVSHTYTTAGVYSATLTAMNSLGNTSATAQVSVAVIPPSRRFIYLPLVRQA